MREREGRGGREEEGREGQGSGGKGRGGEGRESMHPCRKFLATPLLPPGE